MAMTPEPKEEVVTPRTSDFPEAMRQVIAGKKVARVSWGNKDHVFMKDGWLTIFTKNELHTFIINDGDLEGQDWIVVE